MSVDERAPTDAPQGSRGFEPAVDKHSAMSVDEQAPTNTGAESFGDGGNIDNGVVNPMLLQMSQVNPDLASLVLEQQKKGFCRTMHS